MFVYIVLALFYNLVLKLLQICEDKVTQTLIKYLAIHQ
jgi:hypothetical protein